jgi:hypothetical protein
MEIPIKARKPRKDSLYSVEERKIMNQFKAEYRRQPTKEQRGDVIRSKLLPNLYNYWVQLGTAPKSTEESLSRLKVIFLFKHYLAYIFRFLVPCRMGEKQLAPIKHNSGIQVIPQSDKYRSCMADT